MKFKYRSIRYDVLTPEIFEKFYNDIVEFRTAFNLPVNEYHAENDQLHADLFREEMRELFSAETRKDKIDAVIDSLYVTFGALVEAGATFDQLLDGNAFLCNIIDTLASAHIEINFDLFKAWDIIHHSNMSKLCNDENLEATCTKYSEIDVVCCVTLSGLTDNSNSGSALYVVTVDQDVTGTDGKFYPAGKVLKSIDYTPADLRNL